MRQGRNLPEENRNLWYTTTEASRPGMSHLLGIDLGTSSVKVTIIDERGQALGTGSRGYPINTPQPGWAEQDPETWWQATVSAVHEAMCYVERPFVRAIGLSGQMHGTVLVDSTYAPLGPAIIWPDQRSAAEASEITAQVGADRLARIAGTAPATGFLAATLLWMARNDPKRLGRAYSCLLPKDYLRLRLTGLIASEPTDASGTALLDVSQRHWSPDLVGLLDLPHYLLPNLLEPASRAGTLTQAAADALDLPVGTSVVAGCADQVAQAVSHGLIDPGVGSVTIGTGGQLFIPMDGPLPDQQLRLHLFCHAPSNRWYLLGAMLAAGLSLRWLRDLVGWTNRADAYEKLAALAAETPPGAEGLIFLPYLAGERSPLMDAAARGCFVGLTPRHGLGHMARAVMEGVAFALRQILDIMARLNVPVYQLVASGNGLANPIWRQIVSDILVRPLHYAEHGQQASIGAALVAGIGVRLFTTYREAHEAVAVRYSIAEPDPTRVRLYSAQYEQFANVYPALQSVMHRLSRAESGTAP